MKRFLSILDGADKGKTTLLVPPLMIVGRSKNADLQIEDPLVSRRHLEIRIEQEQVFVEDKSSQGSSLNGKPLKGVVSLNSGDVLEIGRTRLRYEESPEEAVLEGAPEPPEALSAEINGTRFADEGSLSGTKPFIGQVDERAASAGVDATRAVAQDGTRMLDPSKLPVWKAPPTENKRPTTVVWGAAAALCILVVPVCMYWIMHGGGALSDRTGSMEQYKDSLFAFGVEYPDNWSSFSVSDKPDLIRNWGLGKEGDKEWTRVSIYADKQPNHALTGLTDGFLQYKETLKTRFKDFELLGSKLLMVNDVAVIFYGFGTPVLQGKGVYVLNGETRIVVECFSSQLCYQQQAQLFTSILQSFRLTITEPQQYIDFPLPDTGMQQLALSNPARLAQQVEEHKQKGEALIVNKDVKPDNLYLAVQECKQACQLAIAGPERSKNYQAAALGLQQATSLYNQALENQRYKIARARNEGDWETAYWEAQRMMQMVPDKTDPAYQEARDVVKRLPLPKRG